MKTIEIEFPNGLILEESADGILKQIDLNNYRYEVEPLAFMDAEEDDDYDILPRYLDEFEVEVLAPGKLRFVRITKRSGYERFEWLLPDEVISSDVLRSFNASVENEGGYWERFFGGILVVYIPQTRMALIKKEFGETIKRWERFFYKKCR